MVERLFKQRRQEEQTTAGSRTMNMPLKVSAWTLLVCLVSFSECNIILLCLQNLVTKRGRFCGICMLQTTKWTPQSTAKMLSRIQCHTVTTTNHQWVLII